MADLTTKSLENLTEVTDLGSSTYVLVEDGGELKRLPAAALKQFYDPGTMTFTLVGKNSGATLYYVGADGLMHSCVDEGSDATIIARAMEDGVTYVVVAASEGVFELNTDRVENSIFAVENGSSVYMAEAVVR